MKNPRSLIRPQIRGLHAYVPGEQPKIRGLIKLNTNENPYPPSPKVLSAVRRAVDGRLRLYPSPTAERLREKLACLHGCLAENIIIGNGSDELLAMAVRAFVEPVRPAGTRGRAGDRNGILRTADTASLVQYFTPSYSLYPVLADIHGSVRNGVPLKPDFTLPGVAELKQQESWSFRAALTFITTPNAPSGQGYTTAELEELCRAQQGVVVLDEAYVDFAEENAMALALKFPHVLVARTFSKAYSLCFQRVGYFVGHRELIAALQKIRDSYNVNGLGQVAAEATLSDLPHYQANFRKIVAQPNKFCPGAPAPISAPTLACETARTKDPGAVVRFPCREQVSENHGGHARRSPGTGESGKSYSELTPPPVRCVRTQCPERVSNSHRTPLSFGLEFPEAARSGRLIRDLLRENDLIKSSLGARPWGAWNPPGAPQEMPPQAPSEQAFFVLKRLRVSRLLRTD